MNPALKPFSSSVVIAPYSPIGREMVHLGAARKIEFVLEMLSIISDRVSLINTAHNATRFSASQLVPLQVTPSLMIDEFIPFQLPFRPLGKAANILFSGSATRYLKSAKPDLVWIYNGHALECRLVMRARKKLDFALAIEIEDTHDARPGRSVKAWLDQYGLKKVIADASLISLVNEDIATAYPALRDRFLPFPGCVSNQLVVASKVAPFSRSGRPIAGYFGGLNSEKGGDKLLKLIIDPAASEWAFIVCGSGPLLSEFKALSISQPDRVNVQSGLSVEALYELMGQTDVIVNPHQNITALNNGVFPFKMLEAVACGRLVVTTPLPACTPDISKAIIVCNDEPREILQALHRARATWVERKDGVEEVQHQIIERYSVEGIARGVRALIQRKGTWSK